MIKLKSTEGKKPEFCDCTGYCDSGRCMARFCFRSVLGLKIPGPKPALDYGTAVHTAMPYLQRENLQMAVQAFRDSWEESGNEEDIKRNTANATKMLTKWHNERVRPGARPYKVIEPPRTGVEPFERYSDQEIAFTVDLGGPLVFAGRIDALGRQTQSGKLWTIEYKTTSELASRFITAFDLNPQIIGYPTAASLIMNEEVEGTYLEALRVSSADPINLCIPKRVSTQMIDSFIHSFNLRTEQILQCWNSGEWPQDFSGCAPYAMFGSHGYLCDYAILCQADNWTEFLDAFVVDYWQPFKELELEPPDKYKQQLDRTLAEANNEPQKKHGVTE